MKSRIKGQMEEWNIGWQPLGNVASSAGRVVMLAGNEIKPPDGRAHV